MGLRRRGLATVMCAFALAALERAGAQAQAATQPAEPIGNTIDLRLANGTIVRIPCDKADPNCANTTEPAAESDSASNTSSARRTPLKRGAKLFDTRNPAVVAGIRG